MLNIQEIKKNAGGLQFDQDFDLAQELKERNREVLDIQKIVARGRAQYENGLYFLDYTLTYKIILASSRSMAPVDREESYTVHEVFASVEDGSVQKDLLEDDLVLPFEGDSIDLAASVADNILLHIPLKVLTPEEEAGASMPTGNDWQVLTEEDYQKQQVEKKEANSPFASLQGLFDE